MLDDEAAAPASMGSRAGRETPPFVKLRVAFTGGGTGGHVYPALAIHDALRARYPGADAYEAQFFGNEDGLEATLVKTMPIAFVPSAPLQRSLSLSTLRTVSPTPPAFSSRCARWRASSRTWSSRPAATCAFRSSSPRASCASFASFARASRCSRSTSRRG